MTSAERHLAMRLGEMRTLGADRSPEWQDGRDTVLDALAERLAPMANASPKRMRDRETFLATAGHRAGAEAADALNLDSDGDERLGRAR